MTAVFAKGFLGFGSFMSSRCKVIVDGALCQGDLDLVNLKNVIGN